MKALLFQIGFLFGGGIAGISLGFNLFRRVDILTAVLRAGIVFCVATVVIVVFLHFFAMVLHRFVTEEMLRQHSMDQDPDKQDEKAGGTASPAGVGRVRSASRVDRSGAGLKGRS